MRVIYVDDEQPALDNFRLTAKSFKEIRSLELFRTGEAALDWAKEHTVDVAFLDVEMPELDGFQLAARLQEILPDIRVAFVTAYNTYAVPAWETNAFGFLLKPYTAADVQRVLERCFQPPLPTQHVVIETIPSLSVTVDGAAVHIARAKSRELFALLVDRGERGITTGEGIAILWPDRPSDAKTQSLFRMTYKRLVDALGDLGIGDIVTSEENRRFLQVNRVECDLYRILSGDKQAAQKYDGQYMREYSWAEERNGQLARMLRGRNSR